MISRNRKLVDRWARNLSTRLNNEFTDKRRKVRREYDKRREISVPKNAYGKRARKPRRLRVTRDIYTHDRNNVFTYKPTYHKSNRYTRLVLLIL